MKRLKYILMITLLAITTLVAAQDPYVIDSVCVGANRDYRIDGEKLSTYDWFILDTFGVTLANPPYTDFREDDSPNPGDTIWGSEINYIWNTVGEFDILTLHYSEHGCDTIEQGRVKVFEAPGVFAGNQQIICPETPIQLFEATATNYSDVLWTSLGDGLFDDDTQIQPNYIPGPNDSIAGSFILVIAANGLAANSTCAPAVDSVEIILSDPEVTFEVTNLLCYNDGSGAIKAIVSGGIEPYIIDWTGPNGFAADTSEITALDAGIYKISIIDNNGCTVVDSVEITEPTELLASIDSIQPIACFGGNDGFAWVSAIGGTSPYLFDWTGPSGYISTEDSIENLPAG
jgi:hypothetical protein